MAKPNVSIYLLPFVTEDSLSPHLSKLKELEELNDTIIKFNFEEQCFNISGETQNGCDDASEIITKSLVPILSANMDKTCLIGTYDDYRDFIPPLPPTPPIMTTEATMESLNLVLDRGNEQLVKLLGRNLVEGHEEDEDLDAEEEENSFPREDPAIVEQYIVKEFEISPLVTNIGDFMFGPPQHNMQYADYIKLIPQISKVECVLMKERRLVKITGEEPCVEDAWNRFHVIQKSYIAHLRPIVKVCIHYPQNTGPFGLFFCNLNLYKHKSFAHQKIYQEQDNEKYYVILPVFVDPKTGQYAPPNDLISKNRNVATQQLDNVDEQSLQYHRQQLQPSFEEEQQLSDDQSKQNDTERLDAAFARVQLTDSPSTPLPSSSTSTEESDKAAKQRMKREAPLSSPSSLTTPTISHFSIVSASSRISYATSTTSEVNQTSPKPHSKSKRLSKKSYTILEITPAPLVPAIESYISSPDLTTTTQYDEESKPSSPISCVNFSLPKPPEDTLDNFPSLSPAPVRAPTPTLKSRKLFSPTLNPNKPKAGRVLRILPIQKSSPDGSISASIINQIKTYNYNQIKTTLEQGLESIRGFKGEVRLSAKLGKVLWTNTSPDVRDQIWTFEDVNDIVMRELSARPIFTNITTADDNIIEAMTSDSILQSQPYNKTAIYEFHCKARNSPSLPYKPIIIHMNQGVIDLRKIVLREKNIAEIDWVSLDRKYDFQLALSTKVLARKDVKPYKTFIGRVSICPITHLMTYEHIPKFLDVDYILFKQTNRYKIDFSFVVEVTRVKMVPVKPVEGTAKINAYTGQGDAWYDFEVRNTINDAAFEENKNLTGLGEEVRWTSKEILGFSDDYTSSDTITDYVKNMLILIEKIERAINNTILIKDNSLMK